MANSEDVWGIDSTRGLSNKGETIHKEYWPELRDDKTRQDNNPEAETGSEMMEGWIGRILTSQKRDTEDLVRYALAEEKVTTPRGTR